MAGTPGPIDEHREAIADLAREHGVVRLEVFGSQVKGTATKESDVDLLVAFTPASPVVYAERYFSLQEALEELLGRPVELIELSQLNNPYFLEAIASSRVLLYAA